MVLFTEAETLLLLDLYLRLRERPQNVASNGVLLKAAARDELTRAVNKAGPREHPLTGALRCVFCQDIIQRTSMFRIAVVAAEMLLCTNRTLYVWLV